MNDDPLYRVFSTLADGRRVYYSRHGRVGLVSEAYANWEVAMHARGVHSIVQDDPMVFAADLNGYMPRSHFIRSLAPFVMVVGMGFERARTPIDRGAYVVGGGRACEAGVWDGGKL